MPRTGKAHEMRERAERHNRWAVVLETAGECALALEHFARAMQLHAAADELEEIGEAA